MALSVGDRAPEFSLPDTDGRPVALADNRGRWVVLVFLRWLG
jgi:peroxiredoxin